MIAPAIKAALFVTSPGAQCRWCRFSFLRFMGRGALRHICGFIRCGNREFHAKGIGGTVLRSGRGAVLTPLAKEMLDNGK